MNNKDSFKLKDLLNVFLRFLWIIIAAAVLIGFLFGFYSGVIAADTYTSSVTLMVYKETSGSLNSADISLASTMVQTYKEVILTPDFCGSIESEAKEQIEANPDQYSADWNINAAYIKSCMSISQVGETEMFVVNCTTNNPAKSKLIADSVAYTVDAEFKNTLPYGSELQTSIINQARYPTANNKNVLRNSILGALCGAVLSFVAVFLYSLFDVTIRDKKKIEDSFNIPVLGVIPRFMTDEEVKK